MYRHILVPTDGSELSLKAAREAVALAKQLGARVLAFFSGPEFPGLYLGDGVLVTPAAVDEHRRAVIELAQKNLAAVEAIAREAGVPYAGKEVQSDLPWSAIVDTAESEGCDLIVMGSHGRGALSGLVLGSQTVKVLSHSKVPVLICR
jgi:nucleotide-binding universal stress UspA family protein